MEQRHKDQIQHQIHHRGNGDKDHGQLAFPHAPENTADGVIAVNKYHAAAADHPIGVGVGIGGLRRIHQRQKLGTEYNAQNSKDHRGNQLCGK